MPTIWITGDTHGDVTRLNSVNFPEQSEMTKDDVVIICGDFGLLWDYKGESKEEKFWLDWLDEKPFTTLFIDGNHECFPRLNALPLEERYGAPVGVVRKSVLHLKRGYVYDIHGIKVFAFGGAASHDTLEGIVNADGNDENWKETAKNWIRQGKRYFRINQVSWWKDEVEQDPAVYQRGLDNLTKYDNKVDLIVTHCCCNETGKLIGVEERDRLTDYLQKIQDTVQYDFWFFGHHHQNRTITGRQICIYRQVLQVYDIREEE
ncbi:MAG: metallophosphoesterase [Erysipelotrichaceae bacterium]|nr:metallophosphoesterase [Erysipelotrichaceae bacterium]